MVVSIWQIESAFQTTRIAKRVALTSSKTLSL